MKMPCSLGFILVCLSSASAQSTLPPQASISDKQNLKGISICHIFNAAKDSTTLTVNAAIKSIAAKYKMPLVDCTTNSKYVMLLNLSAITERNSGMARYAVGFSVRAFTNAFPASVTIYETEISNLVPQVALTEGVITHARTTMEQLAKDYSEVNR